ncbi:hypothetical protein BGZ94_001563 [Podila epigama]|nr:hypothetical protein BGZ94_001563 [Podila epigama]
MAIVQPSPFLHGYLSRMKGQRYDPSKLYTPPPPPPSRFAVLLSSFIGSFVSIAIVASLNYNAQWFLERDVPVLSGAFGASAVLIYGAIEAPLSQPRNVLIGHLMSSLVGVSLYKLFNLLSAEMFARLHWLLCALSVSVSLFFMQLTHTVHPPASATALIAVTGGETIYNLGYWYTICPVGLGISLMMIVALLVNNVARRYPIHWWNPKTRRITVVDQDMSTAIADFVAPKQCDSDNEDDDSNSNSNLANSLTDQINCERIRKDGNSDNDDEQDRNFDLNSSTVTSAPLSDTPAESSGLSTKTPSLNVLDHANTTAAGVALLSKNSNNNNNTSGAIIGSSFEPPSSVASAQPPTDILQSGPTAHAISPTRRAIHHSQHGPFRRRHSHHHQPQFAVYYGGDHNEVLIDDEQMRQDFHCQHQQQQPQHGQQATGVSPSDLEKGQVAQEQEHHHHHHPHNTVTIETRGTTHTPSNNANNTVGNTTSREQEYRATIESLRQRIQELERAAALESAASQKSLS